MALWLLITSLGLLIAGSSPSFEIVRGAARPATAQPALRAHFSQLPLAFEPNHGQAPDTTHYVARAAGLRLDLERQGVRLTPVRPPGEHRGVHLRWVGNGEPASIGAHDELPGRVHYYSADPARTRRDIPTYARVAYERVYPGIDLVFHGRHGAAEFDFVVAPGADPGAIALELDGADTLTLERGNIVAAAGGETLTLHAPVVYQDSPAGRTPVDGRFLLDGRRIAFAVGEYDRTRRLVIDPVVTYSTYLNVAGQVGLDATGNIYVVGGNTALKLNAAGSAVVYSVTVGDMRLLALAVDAAGNAHIAAQCGFPRSGFVSDCPLAGPQLAQGRPQSQGDLGMYALKLSPTGALLRGTSLGGFGTSEPGGIALDAAGNVYVAAWNAYGGFPTTRAAFARPGATPGFPMTVQAIAADFSRYLYAVEFHLDGNSFRPTGIAVDRSGNAYVTGVAGPGLPTTAGAFQLEPVGFGASAVVKIAPGASRLVYATYLGNAATQANAIAVDAGGNAYVAGTAGAGLPTNNAIQPALAGGTDAFVTRFDPAGAGLVFSTYLGGGGNDGATAIDLDSSANVYVAGSTRSVDFPLRAPLPPAFGAAASNFITALTSNGASLIYSTYFADAQTQCCHLVATANGTVYVSGSTQSRSYPTVQPLQATPGAGFLARIEPAQPRVFVTSPAANATVSGTVTSDVWMENTAGNRTIRLSIGSVVLATLTGTLNHVTVGWDSRRVGNGTQTLTATVTDGSGVSGVGSRSFNVQNTGAGVPPPFTVAFTSPASAATVSGSVTVGMAATGASGTPITFTLFVDSAQVFTAAGTTSAASFAWNSASVAVGAHTLRVTARDGGGRTATATRSITVSGGGTPPAAALSPSITAPRDDVTVRGTAWFTVWVNGSAGVSKTYTLTEGGIQRGAPVTTTSSGPVSIGWPTTAANNGLRTVTVTVREGTKSGTDSVRINVAN